MGSVSNRIFSFNEKLPACLLRKYEAQMKEELLAVNIRRERILAVALFMILIIIIGSILIVKDPFILDKYVSKSSIYIHFILITLISLFLIFTNKYFISSRVILPKLKYMHKLIIFFVMFMCSIIAINNDVMNQRPYAYIIAMYSIASLIFMSPKEGLTVYVASYIVYIAGITRHVGISLRLLESVMFSAPLLSLALVVSRINYCSFVNNFVNNKLILDKNEQLDEMNKTIEEMLDMRTEQLNHAMEMDKLKTIFFSNISHELRTPLNVISSAEQVLQLVLREENIQKRKPELLKYNGMIQQNCYRLIRLIENLIDITEIDAGQSKVRFGRCDIVRLLGGIINAAAAYIEKRGIKLTFYSDMAHRNIICDANKLERIILNLLSNAVKFTPAGGSIKVTLSQVTDRILISVQDTGIGIPNEKKNVIFDRFVQVDQSISRLREGSGIGLAIVKAFVELHRGEVSLESIEGGGSNFTLSLPTDLNINEEDCWDGTNEMTSLEKIKMEFSDIYDSI